MELYKALCEISGEGNVLKDEPMKMHTTFRIGGPADYFIQPSKIEEIRRIVTLQLNGVKKMLAQNGIALDFTDAALAFISDKGFDPQFGARPVKRVIQKYVLNELSKELLGGKINKDHAITIDSDGNGLVFKN